MAKDKGTKKFEHRHLKDVLERRNAFKKTKQKQQLKQRKKERRAEENGQTLEEAQQAAAARPTSKPAEALNSMSVDDFFQGGFEIPELPKIKSKKRAREEDIQEESDSGDSDAEDIPSGSELANDDDDSDDDIEAQMAALAENDPDFHKHLQENDPELLNGQLAQLTQAEDSDQEEEDDDDDDEPQRKKQKTVEDRQLSAQTVIQWAKEIEQDNSLIATKKLLGAFRAAVHHDDEEEKPRRKQKSYIIADSNVYHQLLTTTLKVVPAVFEHFVPTRDVKGIAKVSMEHKNFKKIASMIKTYGKGVVELLQNLTDDATLRLTLSSSLPVLPYLMSHTLIVRELITVTADIWSTSSNTDSTRIAAFLVLRRLASCGLPSLIEQVLKAAYQGLVKTSRTTNAHNISGVNLMKNSAAELWGIDASIGYTTGFMLIRQLAVHLRTSIVNNSKDGYKTVYNWQYVHSLDFWSRVLATHCTTESSELRLLIYPLVQVTLGALRLIPTATYFPLRFQLTRSLLRISISTGTYIPLAAPLYEVLSSAEMRKNAKPSTLKALDFSVNIRVPKAYLKTKTYQDGIGEQVQELMAEFHGLWAKSIAFPELALSTTVMLKRWLKDANGRGSAGGNRNTKVNSSLNLLLQKIESNAKFIEEKRAKVDYAPNSRKGVEDFLKDVPLEKTPLGAYIVGQRKQRAEKAKVLEQAREAEKKKDLRKDDADDSDSDA